MSARVTEATYTIICIVIKYQLTAEKKQKQTTAEKNKADNILIYRKPFNLPGTKRNNILLKMKKGCCFRKKFIPEQTSCGGSYMQLPFTKLNSFMTD